ncbi:MAG TPA: TolC family protein [Methylomirabilota bacterium]|nr:TolC family protein [Methylomirabilota bacterium]
MKAQFPTWLFLLTAGSIHAIAADESAVPAARPAEMPVQSVVAQVLTNSPSLKAAHLKWQAALERPEIVAALPDPMLSYGYFFENVETRVGAMNQRFSLSQRFPFPGKRRLASTRAGKEALLTFWDYHSQARELILRAKTACFDLHRIDASREVLEEELIVLEEILGSARARYESGDARSQDILKAQLAATGITNRLLEFERMREATLTRLNALRDQPPSTPLQLPTDLALPALPPEEFLIELALEYRQELQAAGAGIERDQAALALARRERWPDITLGVDYTQINDNIFSSPPDNGQDAVMGFVSINLPLWFGKLKAQEREAELRLQASRETEAQLRATVQSEVREFWFRARVARDQLELYRDSLLPYAEQSLDSTRSGFESGRATFLDVLDSQRALLNLRLGEVMTRDELAKGLINLERAAGMDLDRLPPRAPETPQSQNPTGAQP